MFGVHFFDDLFLLKTITRPCFKNIIYFLYIFSHGKMRFRTHISLSQLTWRRICYMDIRYKLWWIKSNGLQYSDQLIMTWKSNSLSLKISNSKMRRRRRKKTTTPNQRVPKIYQMELITTMKRFMFTFNYLVVEISKKFCFFSCD